MSADAPFAKRLKEARTKAGLTQQELGALAGIEEENASAKMNQYEQGVHLPKYPRLKALAKALKVPTAYFYAESNELADLLYNFERLSSQAKQSILKLTK